MIRARRVNDCWVISCPICGEELFFSFVDGEYNATCQGRSFLIRLVGLAGIDGVDSHVEVSDA